MKKINLINEVPNDILECFVHDDEKGKVLSIKVKPNARIEKLFIQGIEELCLSVAASAVDNAANQRVCELMAQIFSVPKSSVCILSGHKSRLKRILIKKM